MISRRHFFKTLGGLGALGVSTTAYGFGEPVLQLRVTRYDLAPPQWPAGFKLNIAVIADLHACDPWMSLERIEQIVERTNALKPDVIVMHQQSERTLFHCPYPISQRDPGHIAD